MHETFANSSTAVRLHTLIPSLGPDLDAGVKDDCNEFPIPRGVPPGRIVCRHRNRSPPPQNKN
ncbi:hypothetical protein GEV33_010970 [Tenebrio molitor]|uniref:Uncharacterized protein n=1 Tax=Tenebrio molitor TaxID=7067 RepID=A0A8J6HCE3_TENMO|nr:hypothetical protein GEV33_010970 [Tenebrio molitor]